MRVLLSTSPRRAHCRFKLSLLALAASAAAPLFAQALPEAAIVQSEGAASAALSEPQQLPAPKLPPTDGGSGIADPAMAEQEPQQVPAAPAPIEPSFVLTRVVFQGATKVDAAELEALAADRIGRNGQVH